MPQKALNIRFDLLLEPIDLDKTEAITDVFDTREEALNYARRVLEQNIGEFGAVILQELTSGREWDEFTSELGHLSRIALYGDFVPTDVVEQLTPEQVLNFAK